MNYTEFRNKLKAFPNFSIREIDKHFPSFDSRRLVDWQEKGYIQKLRNRHYYFSDQEVDEPFCTTGRTNCIIRPMYPWSRLYHVMVLFRKVYFRSIPAPH